MNANLLRMLVKYSDGEPLLLLMEALPSLHSHLISSSVIQLLAVTITRKFGLDFDVFCGFCCNYDLTGANQDFVGSRYCLWSLRAKAVLLVLVWVCFIIYLPVGLSVVSFVQDAVSLTDAMHVSIQG